MSFLPGIRYAYVILILNILLFLGSCSYPASFVIANLSDGLMEVTYAFKDEHGVQFSCPEGGAYTSPTASVANGTFSSEIKWSPLGTEEFICDPAARTVFVPVGAGVALKLVSHEDPGNEVGALDIKRFPVDRLFINGASGSMEFRGAQVLRAFKRSDTGLVFQLSYR